MENLLSPLIPGFETFLPPLVSLFTTRKKEKKIFSEELSFHFRIEISQRAVFLITRLIRGFEEASATFRSIHDAIRPGFDRIGAVAIKTRGNHKSPAHATERATSA